MFTLEDIKDAHSKVQSGADFPRYIQDLIKLWVKSYTVSVVDGHTEYRWDDSYTISSDARYESLDIKEQSNQELFMRYLKKHQEWLSDYLTFCNQAAQSWITKWVVDTNDMTCAYYDLADTTILIENIPSV